MSEANLNVNHGTQFSSANLGELAQLGQYTYTIPSTSMVVEGKVFLGHALGLTGCEISFNKMAPGQSMPFLHKHRQHEEIYLFIAGQGEFQVDGQIFPIQEGSVVKVDCAGERCWRSTGASDLIYIVVQAKPGTLENFTTQDGEGVRKRVRWE